ncbi:MAG: hypothetical protein MHM6MM_006206 [Cercozoa sp. M6MM]
MGVCGSRLRRDATTTRAATRHSTRRESAALDETRGFASDSSVCEPPELTEKFLKQNFGRSSRRRVSQRCSDQDALAVSCPAWCWLCLCISASLQNDLAPSSVRVGTLSQLEGLHRSATEARVRGALPCDVQSEVGADEVAQTIHVFERESLPIERHVDAVRVRRKMLRIDSHSAHSAQTSPSHVSRDGLERPHLPHERGKTPVKSSRRGSRRAVTLASNHVHHRGKDAEFWLPPKLRHIPDLRREACPDACNRSHPFRERRLDPRLVRRRSSTDLLWLVEQREFNDIGGTDGAFLLSLRTRPGPVQALRWQPLAAHVPLTQSLVLR